MGTMPTTNSTAITPTTKPGNNTGNSTKPTAKPTTNSTSPYFLGIRGNNLHGCKNSTIHQDGKDILNKAKCQVACNALGIPIGKLKDEKLCYVGGDGKCRQTGTPGSGATLVCHKNV